MGQGWITTFQRLILIPGDKKSFFGVLSTPDAIDAIDAIDV